jgi:uncharacterized membrane protein SirB2
MLELYPEIKLIHMSAAIASGVLFFIRGLALNMGGRWAMAVPLRYLTYTIDTVLLAAAVTLAATLHQYPFVHHWLTVKVVLLVVYIVLGTVALKRGESAGMRWGAWIAALVVYGFIISVARAHHPAGWFAGS